ncbi:type II toxin-antitoxin system Phd/YefM family antitoxin [Planococcus sp. APC 3906]|uniref:type II toxin-antitoxin system Phd/YefM family antitoxin n=1 Tax=Planococcus sp. APC 3906 TaxID=3035194 RepID=UPI0025B5A09F|nr:type II toxin-antitoxin system Phd/YefM family antitoxin [Planococcus sp. APC 3906]MDN3451549.1 type II toxin-antitoxin system Phd/YefM family antitoxin [Planococcus sp. APC 3906]
MSAITATTPTNLRKNLFNILEDVTEANTEVIITLKSGKNAVLISEDELNAYRETAYLMSTKVNRDRLNEAITQLENGEGKVRDLIEDGKDA